MKLIFPKSTTSPEAINIRFTETWTRRAKRLIGLDRAVAFTLSGRLLNILSSIGTVLLILHFMSAVAQGYYYTLLSLAALQVIFELGFSFVILQLAAHESAHLVIHPNGRIEGDPIAHARLASVLQLTLRWYSRAAVALCVLLLPVGIAFFAHKSSENISWFGPWIAAVFGVSASFLLTPLYSFLEGCKFVKEVAKLRMYQAIAMLIMSWGAIALQHGLYACAMVNFGMVAVGAIFLTSHRRLLLTLLRYPSREHAVSWRTEIWPFQWQIAVSFICTYFTAQIFTPILFAARGPQEAGRMGLSLSITAYLPIVMLSWISTKATPFGQMIKLRRLKELDSLFFRTLKQALILIAFLAATVFLSVLAVQKVSPRISARMESPWVFAFLLFTSISSFLVQAIAIYLRSFKREPYLLLSLVITTLTLSAILLTVGRWGHVAVALVYWFDSGIIAPIWAWRIFRNVRKSHAVSESDSNRAAARLATANDHCRG